MGVMSRRVLPVCSNLCIFCPSMRARSRQPVKRYKKLLSAIFPRSQEAEVNDRKIGKLCEYACKNPLRIPKITEYLEQKFYKDLRNEHLGSVKVVLVIYKKLLSSCKEQMPLFASSLFGIVRALLEQTRQGELQILGCHTLVDFISNQMDSTYTFNLEGLIPKLCQLAQEVGDDERAMRIRSAGLQVLASMIQFMGEQSHVSMDFDSIISVTLENYVKLPVTAANVTHGSQPQEQWIQGVLRVEDHNPSFQDISKFSPISNLVISRTDLVSSKVTSTNPSYWSRICLKNMSQLANEATTVRRVLEPLFHSFDTENHWSPENGLACSVLTYLQSLLEESGNNSHLLLSILVKHLDHKDVIKQPVLQICILNVATQLSQNVKQQASVAIIGAITDLMKHLRKCIQYSAEPSIPRGGFDKVNADLIYALEDCISQFSNKVGDVGPILDMMAVVLENIPTSAVLARSTIYAVYRTAQVICSIPNISYHKKAFPDALFHHLLLAMSHPDHETRVGAHHIFSTVLMPSLSYSCSNHNGIPREDGVQPLVSLKGKNGILTMQDEDVDKLEAINNTREKENQASDQQVNFSSKFPSRGQLYSFKRVLVDGKPGPSSLRLSSHQVSLLLSSIWIQAISMDNTPACFEALAQTYNLALLFSLSKNSSHMALERCFQLAFSLRRISLDQEGGLQPSRRRALFTLASYMIIFSARAGNIAELISIVKSTLTEETVDPYLELVEDIRLQATCMQSAGEEKCYGSQEDEVVAMNSLAAVQLDNQQLKDILLNHLTTQYGKSSEELSSMKRQLLLDFSPDDAYSLGGLLYMETPQPCSPLAQMEFQGFDEVMAHAALTDEDAFPDPDSSQSARRTSMPVNSLDILSVNQLLESVLETARHVGSLPISSTPIPYDQVKNQCEALVSGKQQKMSVLHSFKLQSEAKTILISSESEKKNAFIPKAAMEITEEELKLVSEVDRAQGRDQQAQGRDQLLVCSWECGQQQSFRLPPSSPYDKFLKAAGC